MVLIEHAAGNNTAIVSTGSNNYTDIVIDSFIAQSQGVLNKILIDQSQTIWEKAKPTKQATNRSKVS